MAVKTYLIPLEQLRDLMAELRLYDVNWMDRLVKHCQEKFPEEKEAFNRNKCYSAMNGKKRNGIFVTRVYTEATILLEQIKEEFAKEFPKTTLQIINQQPKAETSKT